MHVFSKEIKFFGKMTNQEGISEGHNCKEIVESWSKHTTMTDLREFVGLYKIFRKSRLLSPILHEKDSIWRNGTNNEMNH